MKTKEVYQKIKKGFKNHLIDSTAILIESTPFFAGVEIALAGMSVETSLNARFFASGLTYFGMGFGYAKGRDLFRKKFKITDETKEKIQTLADTGYLVLFNAVVAPGIYLASGAKDPNQIALGTLSAIGLGLFNGAPMGYAVDVFRDLTGIDDCNRHSYPNFLKEKSSKFKKGLGVLLIGASIGITSGIYQLTPDKKQAEIQPVQLIEQIQEVAPTDSLEKILIN